MSIGVIPLTVDFPELDVDEWFDEDVANIPVDKWVRSTVLYDDYKKWFHSNHPSSHIPSVTVWGKAMGQNKRVERKREASGNSYYILAEAPKDHEKYLDAYYAGRWPEAIKLAKRLMSESEDLNHYYELMIERMQEGKPDDWDGTYRATSK